MCLIIDSPAGTIVDRRLLANGISDNPDGWGIMSAADGSIIIDRGMSPRKFTNALNRHHGRDLTVHFRWATHGSKNVDNCHPFIFGGGRYALVHNGIMSVPTIHKNMSDTRHFVNYILEPMLTGRPELFGTDYFASILEDMIGRNNKLVILRNDNTRMIINRDEGLDHQGCWLSNAHSLPKRASGGTIFPAAVRFRDVMPVDDDYITRGYMSDDCMSDDYVSPSKALDRAIADQTDDTQGTLWDLVDLSHSEVSDWCRSEPDVMASLILDHLEEMCQA